jgi:glycosyltransferase involved in cell wall biosynthesis
MGRPRVYVDLAGGLDAEQWRRRHEADEVPDAAPYGLHRMVDEGVDVTFRPPPFTEHSGRTRAVLARVARSARHRSGAGAELIEALDTARRRERRAADFVLCYDERTGVPAALVPHRFAPPTITGVAWLTSPAEAPPAMARLARRALPRAAFVFAQSEPIVPLLTSEWGIPRSRTTFVPVGIDTDFYRVQPPPERPGVVVGAGEDRNRDHQLLIDAVASLRPQHPGIALELATGLPVQCPDGLVTLHTGRLDGRMRDVYARSSVAAVALKPSVTGSGLTVALEAMASGRPVVVTANPGMDDYVVHDETGILVPPDDQDALAAAIKALLDDPQRAAEMGAAGAARVRSMFTSAVMARHFAALIRSV